MSSLSSVVKIVCFLTLAILTIAISCFVFWPRTPKSLTPTQLIGEEFVSSKSCRECHQREYDSWHRTYHRTMTQLASPKTIVSEFTNVKLESRGRKYTLERDGDQFMVSMIDPTFQEAQEAKGIDPNTLPTAPRVKRPIVMTTGSHHMQGYWFPAGKGNELLQLPFYYHIEEKRWIPREDVFLRPPDRDPQLAMWNMVCIKCHSVAGVPGSNPTVEPMTSHVAELGIACEACHGPGSYHVRKKGHDESFRSDTSTQAYDRPITHPAHESPKVQSQICGQCHSEFVPVDPIAFWTEGTRYRAGGQFENTHKIVSRGDELYQSFESKYKHSFYNDGTCRVGGDEYNALIASPCYERGNLSCLSCHSMHQSNPNDLLAAGMDGNKACQQCHKEPRFNDHLEEHTKHSGTSNGSLCYNCHMPYTTYALMTALRSHRVTSPRVEHIVRGSAPNACNLCHVDQTLAWTSSHLTEWYKAPEAKLTEEESTVAASLIWLLRGDAVQRAVAAWHLGWEPAQKASGSNWQAPFLAETLNDPYNGVRFQAVKGIAKLPGFEDFQCDFIGSDAEREKARSDVISKWQQTIHSSPGERVLLTPDGRLREDAIKNLLKRKDTGYVRIPE